MAIFILMAAGARAQTGRDGATLRIGLKDAVALALAPEGNIRLQMAEELIRQAKGRSAEVRAALLPNLSAYVGDQNVTRNLKAMGIQLNLPIPGFSFPTLAGPFTVFDARASVNLQALNFGSIRRYQASQSGVRQTESDRDSARDEVRAAVARAYLGALRAQAVLEAAQADVDLAEAVLKQANDQKAAGSGTGIEITRASVQLAANRQRRLVAQNELVSAKLQLLRAMNLDLKIQVELTDTLRYVPAPAVTAEQALAQALEFRADWIAEQKRLETARLQLSAVRMDRLPSVSLFADYGTIGPGLHQTIPTRTYGFTVQVPLFDGGRIDARRAQSASQYELERIQSADLRARIELEIRLALDSLQSAAEQVKTAEEGLTLAQEELAHAQRRYDAGVSPGLELTDAQTHLERARENRIAALHGYNIARINLAAATGTVAREIQ
jgi:outer membrane protein TolC